MREKKKEKLNQELQKRLNELAKLEKEDERINVGRKNNKDDRHRGKGSRRDDRRRMDRHPPSKHREKLLTRLIHLFFSNRSELFSQYRVLFSVIGQNCFPNIEPFFEILISWCLYFLFYSRD